MANEILFLIITCLILNENQASANILPPVVNDMMNYINNLAYSGYETIVKKVNDPPKPVNEDTAIVIEKLPGAARLVTGITLQNGLSNGTILIDKAIIELLNLGSINLQNLETFNKNKADAFLDQLENVKGSIVDGSKLTEQVLIDLDEIREYWQNNENSLKKLPTKLDDLEGVKSWNISGFKTFNVKETLDLLNQISASKSSDYAALKRHLKTLTDALNKAPPSNKYEPVITLLQNISPLSAFVSVMERLNQNPFRDLNIFKTHKGYFVENINALKQAKSGTSSDVSVMHSVVDSQHMSAKTDKKVTTGLVGGFRDLNKLAKDSTDSWLLATLKSSVSLSGVKSLIRFKGGMTKFDQQFTSISSQIYYETLKKAAELQSKINSISINADNIEDTANAASGCPTTGFNGIVTKEMQSVSTHAQQLLKKVVASHVVSKSIKPEHKDLFVKLSDKTEPNDIQKISDLVQKLKLHLEIIQEDTKLETIVDEIKKHPDYIIKFHSQTTIGYYTTYLKCIDGIQGSTEKAASLAKLLITLRNLKDDTDFGKHFKEISTAVSQSSGLIKTIRAVGMKIKNDNSSEVGELTKLRGLKMYSESFGKAVTVLVNVKTAFDKKTDFDKFIEQGRKVQQLINNHKDAALKKELKKNWDDFEDTALKIATFFSDFKTWQSKIQIPKGSSLPAYRSVFKELSKMKDLNLNSEKRLIAVERLEEYDPINKNQVDEFRESLLKLSKLDLQFSRYKSSLIEMPVILKGILSAFRVPKSTAKVVVATTDPGMHETQRNFLLSWLFVIVVGSIGCIIGCKVDKKSLYHLNKYKIYKPKLNMKTAREGGPPKGWKPGPVVPATVDGRRPREPHPKSLSISDIPITPELAEFQAKERIRIEAKSKAADEAYEREQQQKQQKAASVPGQAGPKKDTPAGPKAGPSPGPKAVPGPKNDAPAPPTPKNDKGQKEAEKKSSKNKNSKKKGSKRDQKTVSKKTTDKRTETDSTGTSESSASRTESSTFIPPSEVKSTDSAVTNTENIMKLPEDLNPKDPMVKAMVAQKLKNYRQATEDDCPSSIFNQDLNKILEKPPLPPPKQPDEEQKKKMKLKLAKK